MSRVPTVVWNAVSAKSGGASTYIANLANALARDNSLRNIFLVPPHILRTASGDALSLLHATDVGFRSPLERLLWDQTVLRRIVERERADLLISTSDFGMFCAPCFQILMVRNPTFFSEYYIRRILPRKSSRARLSFEGRKRLVCLSACAADLVVTATTAMMSDLRRYAKLDDASVLINPFGVPLDRFPPKTRRAPATRPFQFLYVSEYADYKNLTVLLETIGVLAREGDPGIRLVTTASPDQFQNMELISRNQDRKLASNPQVWPYVNFTGPVAYSDIQKLYQEADAFVFPSVAESFGHPLVEAMATGLPVLVSDLPVHREICGDAAIYFDPYDSENLAKLLVQVRNDDNLQERLSKAGRHRVCERFGWDSHVERFRNIIHSIVSSRHQLPTGKNPFISNQSAVVSGQ